MSKLKRGLIVSCQAEEGSPFNAPAFIAAFAKAAELGGAVAVRLRDPENVAEVRKVTELPIIGLTKGYYESGKVLITPSMTDVNRLIDAGSDIVAIDVTKRIRLNGKTGLEFLHLVKSSVHVPIMADISTAEEALAAASAGADYVGTTLSGYTEQSLHANDLPDFELIAAVSSKTSVPVIAEGRIWNPDQAKAAFESGAYAVCVGTAITRPVDIVKRFVSKLSPC